MKIASIIFIALGIVINFSYSIIIGVIGAIIGVIALVTLSSNQKSILVGVLSLIFTGLIGGILYLCWNPDKNNN